jgi:spore coat polysaccharide biosynthesis protein SpsF
MLYPLGGKPVIGHVIERTNCAETLDEVVVATSDIESDAVIADVAQTRGTPWYRGDKSDVLGRMLAAATEHDADAVIRICGDNPLLSPRCIDAVVKRLLESKVDYISNNLERTFPKGLDVEAFTMESFRYIDTVAERDDYREHATLWYRENENDDLILENVVAQDVFPDQKLLQDPNLRLTLDRVDDYRLLQQVYNQLSLDERDIIDTVDAVRYINKQDLSELNRHVTQRDPSGDHA